MTNSHLNIGNQFLFQILLIQKLPLFCFQAFCEEGNIEDNGVLAFAKFVIFSVLETRQKTG